MFAYGIVCSRGSDIFISCFLFAGICISVDFSDGHVNPAITLAFWENGTLTFARAQVYWLAQFLGAFAGACLAYGKLPPII